MNKKPKNLGWIIAGVVVLVLVLWGVGGYNGLVNQDEEVNNKWANVETQYQKAQGDVTTALGKLLAITENYPDLKANQNFLELQSQLEGTENRINVARKDFNDAAKEYNVSIRRFPKSIIAGICGFDKKNYFEAEAGADKAPKVEF